MKNSDSISPEAEKILRDFGLDNKELTLYLTSLSLGQANMTDLSRKSKIKRSSCYLIFKSLSSKGLMGSVKTSSGLAYSAVSPESLLDKARVQMSKIELIIPELKAISQKPTDQPKIMYHEGEAAYKLALEDCLKKPNITIRHFGSLKELHQTTGEEYDKKYFVAERVSKNIFLKAIYTPDVKGVLDELNDKAELREIKYLPESYKIRTSTLIYDNKVVISSSQKELITVVIESEEIARSEEMKFDFMWELMSKTK